VKKKLRTEMLDKIDADEIKLMNKGKKRQKTRDSNPKVVATFDGGKTKVFDDYTIKVGPYTLGRLKNVTTDTIIKTMKENKDKQHSGLPSGILSLLYYGIIKTSAMPIVSFILVKTDKSRYKEGKPILLEGTNDEFTHTTNTHAPYENYTAELTRGMIGFSKTTAGAEKTYKKIVEAAKEGLEIARYRLSTDKLEDL